MQQRYDLGNDVRAHLREHLNLWDYRALTKRLTDLLDIESGALFAYLPLGLTDLSRPALMHIRGSTYNMYQPLYELTKQHLKRDDAVWIVPDVMLNESVINSKMYASLTLTYKHEVYHALADYPADDDILRQMLRVTEDWQYIGVLTYAEKLRGQTGRAELSSDDMDTLAKNAETLIYDPFDGEGYAIWQKEEV